MVLKAAAVTSDGPTRRRPSSPRDCETFHRRNSEQPSLSLSHSRRHSEPHSRALRKTVHSRNSISQASSLHVDQDSPEQVSPSSQRRRSSSSFSNSAVLGLGGGDDVWTRLSTTFESDILHSFVAPRMFAVNNAQTQTGPDLPEVQTEAIGFQAIAGETKLRLLPSPWLKDALPKPTSTLISIASRNELVAAAGPQTLIIATTPAIRDAFVKEAAAENNVKSFTPQLSIDVPRLSQVAFSSDENYLTICADEGGGLAVYDVQELKQGSTQQAFQLGTNGTGVRALVPNPAPENGHVVAVVLTNGQLLLANLKDRQFTSGTNGMVLREGVSCISWSAKGKQLVAGLENGAAVQMSPDGDVKAEIPRPQLDGNHHVSGISWLANDLFLIIYNPTNSDYEGVPDSTFILVTRQPRTTNYMFQKLQDPCGTFGMNRCPPHHFLLRLRDFPPNLTDAILVSSTGSGDIGLFTCSTTPLSGEPVAANTANVYTTTPIANDARRAQLPVYDEMSDMSGSTDTSPIGMVLDLSSKENVKRPMPAEEIEASSTPLPALMVLNNEGVLSSWWFVYAESVRQGTAFPGLVAASSTGMQIQPTAPPQQQQSAFGGLAKTQSPFGATTTVSGGTFGTASNPAFGAPAFGAPSFSTPSNISGGPVSSNGPVASFGAATLPGANKPTWGTPAVGATSSQFGKPAFGTSTALGAAGGFGAAGGLGKSQSPWGTPAATAAGGHSTNPFSNSSVASPFSKLGDQPSTGAGEKPFSPFSSTSAASPFSALGQQHQKSVFGGTAPSTSAPTQPSVFGSSFGAPSTFAQTNSLWGTAGPTSSTGDASTAKSVMGQDSDMSVSMEEDVPAADKGTTKPSGLSEHSSSGFQLGSSFKPDTSSKDDGLKPTGTPLFGSGFSNALPETGGKPEILIKQEPKTPPDGLGRSTTPQSLVPKTGPPFSGGFIKGPGESKPFLPPTTQAQTSSHQSVLKSENTTEPPKAPSPKRDEGESEPEPAPLPPSPIPPKARAVPEPEPTNLPSSPKQRETQPEETGPSPAGSPPIDLGEASSSPLSSAESIETREADGSEPDSAPLPPDFLPKPTWGFSSPKRESPAPPSPSIAEPSLSGLAATPMTTAKTQPSRTPASATKPPVFFQPPSIVQESPRSPSPVRNQRPSAALRSLSSPTHPATQLSTTPLGPPPVKSSLGRPITQPLFKNQQQLASVREDRTDNEFDSGEFVDDSDEKIREELSRPVEPTKELAPFLAHQDYVGKVSGEGVASQAEKVYRDINSMIDTLGLNARSLSAFVKGHSELFPDGGRERSDLDEDDDWCLIEIEDLAIVQKQLTEQLEADRPQDIKEKTGELREMLHELVKFRSRHHDLQKLIRARQAPKEGTANSRGESLTSEQSTVLADLRKEFSNFQKLLSDVEDAASLLKAKLASAQTERNGSQTSKVPTVEAIINTIGKMTRMIEGKSGDVDVLEAQMKKLRFRSRAVREGTPTTLDEALGRLSLGSSTGGRDVAPFATPPNSRSKTPARGTYQLTYSPDTSDDDIPSHRRSLHSSRGAVGKKKSRTGKLSDEQVRAFLMRQESRRRVLQLLKEKVCEKGTKVTGPEV